MIPMLRIIALFGTAAGFAAFAANDDAVARGKYLVEEVSKCQMCHTARNEAGEMDKSNWLKGATLDFQPTHEMKGWHKTAPDITGESRLFERWKDDGVTKFLETALGPTGHKADPPMPEYKLTHDDAVAITQYLKSLK
jgi:mono/diheme cytochrome c family protein